MTLLLAAGTEPTVLQAASLLRHAADCETCRRLTAMADDQYRWVVRIPHDAIDDKDLLVLPIVDPVVFTTEEELARGGMGRITRARDRRLGREVAIKEVLDPSLRARFEREAMITASLQHPAIVPVYEAGTWPDGSSFYAMRLVSGGTLQDAIAKTATLEERLALLPHIRALTEALAYAHSRRIVHRDLKPGNVLVGEFGETVVIDWGLAKELDRPDLTGDHGAATGGEGLTHVGAVMGTAGFMSPEQAAGMEVDERADVYALGAILYNVLAGQAPYVDLDVDKIVAARERPPTPIATLAPGAPADLRAIVERAMARPADARYPTALQMAEELRRFEAGQLLKSREYGLRELVVRWIRKHRSTVIAGGSALLIVAVVGIGAVIGIARSRAAERDARELAEAAQHTAETARKSAEQARGEADHDAIALLEEQGRTELLAGDRERAVTYLSEAYHRGRDTVELRHLLAAASRDLALADPVIEPAAGEIKAIQFAADGRAVIVAGAEQGRITVWTQGKPVSHPLDVAIDRAALSASADRAAIITDADHFAMYDTATGQQLWMVQDPKFHRPTVLFDPTGKSLVVLSGWSDETRIHQIREVATGALRLTLDTPASVDAAFSSDGRLVATIGVEGTIAVWEASSGKSIFKTHVKNQLTTVAFLGKDRIVVGTTEREAWIWRLDGRPPIPLSGHHDQITVLSVNPYGDLVAIGESTGGVHLWSSEGELLGESHDARGAIGELVWSPDQALLLGGGADKRAYVWEITSLALRGAVTAFQGAADDPSYRDADQGLAWGLGGARFATVGSGEDHAALWKAPSGARIERFWSRASAITDKLVVTVDEGELLLRRLDTGTQISTAHLTPEFPKLVDALGQLGSSRDLAVRDFVQISRDGRRALVWGSELAALYDLTSGARLGDVPASKAMVNALVPSLSTDGRFVLTVDATGARLVDPATHQVARELAIPGAIDGALAPDNDRLVLVFEDKAPRMWRWSTGTEVPLPGIPPGRHARFDASGRRVVVYGTTGATVIDLESGAIVANLGGKHDAAIEDARFDGSGHRMVTWARDHAAKLGDLETHAVLVAVEGVARRCAAVTDDGARFATGAPDGAIEIWDSATARLLEVLHGERGVAGLTWSADGSRLLAHAIQEHATVWDVHLEQRSPAELVKLVAEASSWKLVGGTLVPRTFH